MYKKNLKRTLLKLFIAFALLSWLNPALSADEPNLFISSATLNSTQGGYFLNAEIDISLSDEAIEALDNGVTLIFDTELKILEQRQWLWLKHQYARQLTSKLKYHTLAETYQVTDITHHHHHFSSLWAALLALGTLQDIPLHGLTLSAETELTGKLAMQLNIEALPLPMRPLAYITPGWYLRSDPYLWPITP
ncbi:MAG: hypothetical protein A6F71_03800 [Cycloclasticus sp. symbiont of Poecilosclerida sp. M]|nr:MAG: hypothetical protein A6F71_03800 [Cycloclasticus sp. symbiont of Poecilosclerida sp. M]